MLTIESPAVAELKKQNNDDGSVTLRWKKPAGFNGTNANAQYVVAYNGERYTLNMNQTEYTIKSKQKDESFTVEVRNYLMGVIYLSRRYVNRAQVHQVSCKDKRGSSFMNLTLILLQGYSDIRESPFFKRTENMIFDTHWSLSTLLSFIALLFH